MFSPDQIADVQGFNKVYLYLCKQIDDAILNAGYSLTEKDVLLEISKTERCTANILTQRLHIDRSYMSRMIAKFEKKGLIEKTLSKTDSRVRYIRLTELIPELLDMVDEKKIAFNPAVELSYLKKEEQKDFLEAMDYAQATPSLSQAQRLKKFSQEGKCSLDAMCAIMSEEKKSELDKVTIKNDVLRKYFPKSYTPKQMEDTIIKLLEQWQKKREKSMER